MLQTIFDKKSGIVYLSNENMHDLKNNLVHIKFVGEMGNSISVNDAESLVITSKESNSKYHLKLISHSKLGNGKICEEFEGNKYAFEQIGITFKLISELNNFKKA